MISTAADVDALLRLMPPPENGRSAVDWDRMAQSWGRPFPPDYQRFIEVYGAGVVQDFLVVLAPQPKAPLPGCSTAATCSSAATTAGWRSSSPGCCGASFPSARWET